MICPDCNGEGEVLVFPFTKGCDYTKCKLCEGMGKVSVGDANG